jgi:DNA-binding MurR/RpiR family transcriptional regulator
MAKPYKSQPATAEELRERILEEYESLSKVLKHIAQYVLDEPSSVALETLAVLSERMNVHPSAIVRLAKHLGFEGASPMQKLLRDSLLSSGNSLGYAERVRQFKDSASSRELSGPDQVLTDFVQGNVLALENLNQSISANDLKLAVDLIAKAGTIYVAGFRRSFPVASYLAYSLHQVDKKTVFIDSVGGMTRQQIHGITESDLLLVVSYHPYAEEAVYLVSSAVEKGSKVLAISDSLVSPVAKPASLVLQVREAEIRKFRSLSASMCLAQSLVMAYAFAHTDGNLNQSSIR